MPTTTDKPTKPQYFLTEGKDDRINLKIVFPEGHKLNYANLYQFEAEQVLSNIPSAIPGAS